MAAYVAMPPFPPHPDQIVGVHWREIGFPEPTQKILKRGEAEPAPGFLVVEIRAEPHDRPDLRMASEPGVNIALVIVEAAVPGWV